MDRIPTPSGCAACLSRRRFLLSGGAACAGVAGCLAMPTPLTTARVGQKARIRIVHSLHAPVQERPDWPNVGFDFRPVMEKIETGLRRACPDFDFNSAMAAGEEQARKVLEDDRARPVDGYLVYQLNCWNRVVQTIATSGKPVLYADFQFGGSGGFLVYNAGFLREGISNVGFLASSRFDDLVAMMDCFRKVRDGIPASEFGALTTRVRVEGTPRPGDLTLLSDPLVTLSTGDCLRRMKESKILAVRDETSGPAESVFSVPVERIGFAEVNDAWKSADLDQSREVADRWEKNASVVSGASRETLETSAAMYLGLKSVLQRHQANAITVNCLGGFYGGHIHAYPCLGFHELCNEGLVGACECDVASSATMVAVTALTQGRPGYISDPVIDTSKRQIIYAHCVASNRAFGPDGHANAYEILTHSEDRQGASLRSILPVGYLTTTLKVDQATRSIILHQARAAANDPDDRACRTKLCAEPVGDLEKLFAEWDRWGWHRVTFYGDLKRPVAALADALAWRVVEEA